MKLAQFVYFSNSLNPIDFGKNWTISKGNVAVLKICISYLRDTAKRILYLQEYIQLVEDLASLQAKDTNSTLFVTYTWPLASLKIETRVAPS